LIPGVDRVKHDPTSIHYREIKSVGGRKLPMAITDTRSSHFEKNSTSEDKRLDVLVLNEDRSLYQSGNPDGEEDDGSCEVIMRAPGIVRSSRKSHDFSDMESNLRELEKDFDELKKI